MKKNILVVLTTIFITTCILGQTCDCAANFQWVKKTFEENDAGFQYIIDQKGKAAYEALNNTIALRAKESKTLPDCQTLIMDWSKFFRKGHFYFGVKQNVQQPVVADPARAAQQEAVHVDSIQFDKRVNAMKEPTPEGIWISEPYTVGIIKIADGYKGFILNAYIKWA